MKIKKVTNVRTIAEAMNKSTIYKGMLGEVDKLLKLYFTFPVTTATAERSFSSLRRIKTFLRSTMTHCRLNNLFWLYIHTSRTDLQDLSAIAKEFVSVNSWRLHYFGKWFVKFLFCPLLSCSLQFIFLCGWIINIFSACTLPRAIVTGLPYSAILPYKSIFERVY